MRRQGGIFRLFLVFSVCIVLIGYNIYGKTSKWESKSNDFFAMPDDNSLVFEEEKSSSSSTTSSSSSESTGSAVQTSANSSVSGKIIERYISPYKTGLSYDKAYVKNSTDLKLDLKSLLTSNLSFKLEKSNNPVVLIMHTHTTESFLLKEADTYSDKDPTRSRDKTKSVVSVGDIVAKKLNDAGVKTIHDTTVHDYPEFNGCYTRAAKTITGYLKKYPSIKIVIDVHRDSISAGNNDKCKLVTEINGKKAAQVMIVMGSQSGTVTNFPNWKENFKLALKMQQQIEKKFPTLARPLSLMPRNYNESLSKGSVLMEFGTEVNTLEEVQYSAQLVGEALAGLYQTFV